MTEENNWAGNIQTHQGIYKRNAEEVQAVDPAENLDYCLGQDGKD